MEPFVEFTAESEKNMMAIAIVEILGSSGDVFAILSHSKCDCLSKNRPSSHFPVFQELLN